jgi:hypothetical protein
MKERREWTGILVGILTFLVGIAIVVFVFSQALSLFQTPPEQALGLKAGKPLDANEAGRSGIALIFRIFLLLVMCWIGSVIANRGIKLYSESRKVTVEPENTKETGA